MLVAASSSGCASLRVGRWPLTPLLTSLLLLLSLGSFLGCTRYIRLAYVGPLSGADQVYSKLESQAAQLAIFNFNASSSKGIRSKLLLVDTAKMPTKGLIRLLRRRHHIQAIVGPPSSALAAELLGQLEQQQMVMLSASASHPQLTYKNPWFFRLQPSDELQSEVMALFVLQRLGKSQAALIHTPDNYADSLAKNFIASYQQAGGTILESNIVKLNNVVESNTTDSIQYLRALAQQPRLEVLYLATDLAGAHRMLAALAQVPLPQLVVGSDTFSKLELRQHAPRSLEGMYYATAALHPSDAEQMNVFLRDYYRMFHGSPDIFAVNAYDASQLLIRTIAALIGSRIVFNRQDIRRELAQTQHFPGLGGEISFDQRGEVQRGIAVYHFFQGKPRYIDAFRIRSGRLVSGG